MLEIFREAAAILAEGRRGALATIVSTRGSTPGKECAKLLVREDGSTVGTVGGGCTENDIRLQALQVMAEGRPRRASFRLTAATAAETGLLCGGEFEVFIEPLGNPIVIILGAGHVARSLGILLDQLEYRTIVRDDRESFASSEHFPASCQVQVRAFSDCLADLEIGPQHYIVIVTRGHEHDETALRQAIATDASYIGLIGSRVKVAAIFKNLESDGVPRSRLRSVRAPIGIPIGSRTPEELALSIAAEIIAFRHGVAPAARNPAVRSTAPADDEECR